jgi:hypothetical protein
MKIGKAIESCWDCDHITAQDYCLKLKNIINLAEDESFNPDCPLEDYTPFEQRLEQELESKIGHIDTYAQMMTYKSKEEQKAWIEAVVWVCDTLRKGGKP